VLVVRCAKGGEQFAAAADTDLVEDRFQVVLDGVAGDDEPLGDGAGV
jgi:hypothetical protein